MLLSPFTALSARVHPIVLLYEENFYLPLPNQKAAETDALKAIERVRTRVIL